MKPFFIFFFLFVVACTPIGKVTESVQTARATGPADPPGGYASPGTKLVLSPTSLSFATTDAIKTITVTATDAFVHQKIFLCKTPCTSRDNWKEVGSFDGTPVIGTYIAGTAGISKQLALSRDDLMDGNNFIVVFTCGGIGLCNGNKWLLQKFTVFFAECGTDADCSSGKKCIREKCISLCSSDSECVLKSDPCGCFNTKDPLPPATGIVCSQVAGTQCLCDRTCKVYVPPTACAENADGTKCGDVRVCKNQECVYDKCADVVCIATKHCNPEDGSCVDCLADINCPFGQKCKSTTKTCVTCLADTDCSVGQKCVNNACVLVCATPPENMVSWFAGDDTAKDLIRGTTALVQGATYDVGKVGQAFKFDGVDDEVVIPHRDSLSFAQNAPISIDAWVFQTGTGTIGHIFGKRSSCSSMNYQLAYDPQSGLHFSSDTSVAASNTQPPLNTWTHIAGTFDGSVMKIYINGELKGTATGATLGASNTEAVKIGASGTCGNRWKGLIDEVEIYNRALTAAEIKAIFDASTAGKCKPSTLPPACSPACIAPKKCDETLGSCVDCLADGDCATGKKCDTATSTCVDCFVDANCPTGQRCKSATKTCVSCLADSDCASGKKCELTSNTCVTCYDNTHCSADQKCVNNACVPACATPPENMVSWLAGNGNARDTYDGNDGWAKGGTTFPNGKVGQAFNLDGSTGHVSLGNPTSLKFTESMSITAWINPVSGPASGELTAIVTKWGQRQVMDGYGDSYGLWLLNRNGILKLFGGLYRTDNGYSYVEGGSISLNTFSHVAMTYNSNDGTHTLYLNGQQIASATLGSRTIFASDKNVLIGREDTSFPRPFTGMIDEVQLYKRALSASEIKAIVDAGSLGVCPATECTGKADGTACSRGICQSNTCTTVISTTQQVGAYSTIVVGVNAGSRYVPVGDILQFGVGDDVIIHQTKGPSSVAGLYEWNTVESIFNNQLVLKTPLVQGYATSSTHGAQVVKVQKYSSGLIIKPTGTLTAPAWDGSKGGILTLQVNGPITIEAGGKIDMGGKGFRGCTMSWKNDFCQYWVNGRTGESYTGGHNTAIAAGNPNVGGGGGGLDSYDGAGGGGGGAHLTAGTAGTGDPGWTFSGTCPAQTADYSKGKGGGAYTSYDLSTKILFGSGGGCGDRSSGTTGGGSLFILAGSIVGGAGSLKADGNNGGSEVTGAGAGGSIYIETTVPVDSSLLSVTGGTGGTQSWKNLKGGNGGTGATKLVSRLRT